MRGGAMIYLGLSMQASGQAQAAERLLLDAYEVYGNKADTYALFILRIIGFHLFTIPVSLTRPDKLSQILRQVSIRHGMILMKNWADWFLGVVCYQRNELEEAAKYFTQIFENRYTAQISTLSRCRGGPGVDPPDQRGER